MPRPTAPAATRYGLVNEVVPADRLDACVQEWTGDLVRSAPLAVRASKEAAAKSVDMPLERAFTAEYGWEERHRHSSDAVEGARAYADNRRVRRRAWAVRR